MNLIGGSHGTVKVHSGDGPENCQYRSVYRGVLSVMGIRFTHLTPTGYGSLSDLLSFGWKSR